MTEDLETLETEGPDRMRIALAAILVLLLLLMAGMVYALFRVLTPIGAPGTAGEQLPPGLTWVRSIYGFGPKEDQQFRAPTDVAVSPDGTIWGTDPQRARVLGFNPDGTFKTLIHRGPSASGPGRLSRPEGVGVDEAGNVYIADYAGNKIAEYTADNKLIKELEVPFPLDVAVTKDRIYVSAVSGVAVFGRDYSFVGLWGRRGIGPEEFDTPRGIAVGADGTVYVSDTNNARVKAYSPDGKLLWIWPKERDVAQRPGASNKIKTTLQLPSAACIDGAGRLVLVDPFRFQILAIDPAKKDDKLVGGFGDFGGTDGLFAYPTGIAYDPARDWFVVADTANDRLQIVRITGSASNPVLPALTRAFAGPWWLCGIPLALLVLGAVLAALQVRAARRARALAASEQGEAGVAGDVEDEDGPRAVDDESPFTDERSEMKEDDSEVIVEDSDG